MNAKKRILEKKCFDPPERLCTHFSNLGAPTYSNKRFILPKSQRYAGQLRYILFDILIEQYVTI